MIKVRGDTHGFYSEFLDIDKNMNSGDICLICGDCGLVFHNDFQERRFLDELEARPYTIAFVDGNHENFAELYKYPEEIWHGGRIHRIRKNIIHLCRGQVFDIDGVTFFTFGGGYSLDKAMRVPGKSWWSQEMPSYDEYEEGKENLQRYNWKVDYIISHTTNIETIKLLAALDKYSEIKSAMPEEAPLNFYLEEIRELVDYKHWFFGHFHKDKNIAYTKQTAVFGKYIELRSEEENYA